MFSSDFELILPLKAGDGAAGEEWLVKCSVPGIAERFLNKFHLEGRAVAAIAVRAVSSILQDCTLSWARSCRQPACFSMLVLAQLAFVLSDREERWKGHQGDEPDQGFTPRSQRVTFSCQSLFHSDISRIFDNLLFAASVSLYHNVLKCFSGETRLI